VVGPEVGLDGKEFQEQEPLAKEIMGVRLADRQTTMVAVAVEPAGRRIVLG